MKGTRQGLRQSRFAHTGHIFDQQVSASEQRDQRQLDHVVLAFHHLRDCAGQPRRWFDAADVCGFEGITVVDMG